MERLGLCLCVWCQRRVFRRGGVCWALCEAGEAAQDLGVGCADEGLGEGVWGVGEAEEGGEGGGEEGD